MNHLCKTQLGQEIEIGQPPQKESMHLYPFLTAFIPLSYMHSDENHQICNVPPMEIPEEYGDKLNIIYTL